MSKKLLSVFVSSNLILSACAMDTNFSEIEQNTNESISVQSKNDVLEVSIKDVFSSLDVNKDNKISKSELTDVLDLTLDKNTEKNKIFEAFMKEFKNSDDSKDGYLDQQEFKVFNSKDLSNVSKKNSLFGPNKKIGMGASENIFNTIKDSKNGISQKAFVNYIIQKRNIPLHDTYIVENMFMNLDVDRNEFLTKEELSYMILPDSDFIKKFKAVVGGTLAGVALIVVLPVHWVGHKLGLTGKLHIGG